MDMRIDVRRYYQNDNRLWRWPGLKGKSSPLRKARAFNWLPTAMLFFIGFGLFMSAPQRAGAGNVRLELLRTIAQPQDAFALAWSPDGQRLAEMHDYGREISIWNRDGELLRVIRRPIAMGPHDQRSLSFLAAGRTLLGPAPTETADHRKNAFALWNSETGAIERLVPGPEPNEPDARLSTLHNTSGLLSLSRDNALVAMRPLYSFGPVVLYSSQDWRIIFVRQIRYRDIPIKWSGSKAPPESLQPVLALAVAPDRSVSIGLPAGILIVRPPFMHGEQTFIGSLPDGDLGVIAPAGKIVDRYWRPRWPNSLAYSPDGRLLAIGIKMPSDDDDRKKAIQSGDQRALRKLAYLKIWNVETRQVVAEDSTGEGIADLDWSHDGRFLAAVTVDRVLKVYQPNESGGLPVAQVPLNGVTFTLRFSPTAHELAVTAGSSVLVYAVRKNN